MLKIAVRSFVNIVSCVCVSGASVTLALMVSTEPCLAIAPSFTQADIGGALPAGTYTVSAGTYSVTGGGTDIGGMADSCTYVSTTQAGNIELTTKVNSLTSSGTIDPYAIAGVMVRQSTAPDSAMAVVGVSPRNGVNFICRKVSATTASMTLGPSIAAPVWLRLGISGNRVAGYSSPDGVNWTLIGKSEITIAGAYQIGYTICSKTNGVSASASFSNLSIPVGIPQVSADMMLWLRSDAGVTASGGTVSKWVDQSDSGYVGTPNAGGGPFVDPTGINGLPLVYNGVLYLSPGFSDFTRGMSIFQVVKLESGVLAQQGFYFYTAAGNNDRISVESFNSDGSPLTYTVYKGSTSYVIVNNTSLPSGFYVSSVVQTPNVTNSSVMTSINHANVVSGVVGTPNVVRRTPNQFSPGSGTAEVLIFNRSLTQPEIDNISAYFYNKYGVGSAPVLAAPIFTPPAAKYPYVSTDSPPTVSISSTPGTLTYYSTDGSPVTTASQVYSGPIAIAQGGMTIKAASAFPGSTTLGPVGSANFEVSPTFLEVPTAGQQLWLSADSGVVANSSGQVTQWYDLSGHNLNATQALSANMPILSSLLLNQSPFITFNGSQFLSLPTSTVDYSAGADFYLVTQPNTPFTTGERFFDFGATATTTNNLFMSSALTTGTVQFGSTTTKSITTPSTGELTGNIFQVLEGQQNGAPASGSVLGSILINGSTKVSSTTAPLAFATLARPFSYIASDTTGAAHMLNGSIAELISYNVPLTASQQQYMYSYFVNKYALTQITTPPVTFVPASGTTLPNPGVSQAAIIVPQGVTAFFTTDGTTPTTSSPVYNGQPITASPTHPSTLTVKVLPVLGGFPAGAVQTATYSTP